MRYDLTYEERAYQARKIILLSRTLDSGLVQIVRAALLKAPCTDEPHKKTLAKGQHSVGESHGLTNPNQWDCSEGLIEPNVTFLTDDPRDAPSQKAVYEKIMGLCRRSYSPFQRRFCGQLIQTDKDQQTNHCVVTQYNLAENYRIIVDEIFTRMGFSLVHTPAITYNNTLFTPPIESTDESAETSDTFTSDF